jgi:hypothetical protein
MSGGDDSGFLTRWSKRKVAAREGRQAEEQATAAAASPEAAWALAPGEAIAPAAASGRPDEGASALPPELPPVASLRGLASEYRDFMRAEIDPALKRAALRKLFADPHFNVMDGLDVYIDDYSVPDPLPEAMLASLEHAKPLFRPLFEARDAAAREPTGEPSASPPGDTDRAGGSLPAERPQCRELACPGSEEGADREHRNPGAFG